MPSPAAILFACVAAIASIAHTAAVASPGTVGYSFERRRVNADEYPHLSKRQSNTVLASLTNEYILYFINVTVGTPGQPFSLQLDTGSSDIWFPAENADICRQNIQYCPVGTYDSAASSTYNDPQLPEFQIQYVDGSEITGQYVSDVLTIGDTTLTNMTMAEALTANTRGIGIMGIGFQSGEAAASQNGFTYPNVINVLKNQGFINTMAYSLWLDNLESSTGSILFGGVDTNKYHGDLVSLPIQIDTQSGAITSFTVAWTGLTASGSGQTYKLNPSSPLPAILDSGTTDTLLPDDIANAIFNGVGVLTNPDFGNVVRCSLAEDDLTFSFQFGGQNGPIVNVSLAEFVTPLLTTDGSQPTFQNGDPACSFAIEAAGENPILFGDSFLRSAYVVYDLENEQIAIAQTNFDADPSNQNVQAIPANGDIPNVASTASAASVAQTFTGNPRVTEATATATGDLAAGTSRSATFQLSATGGSSTSSAGSSTSNAANPHLRPASFSASGFFAGLIVLVGFAFGGGLVLL